MNDLRRSAQKFRIIFATINVGGRKPDDLGTYVKKANSSNYWIDIYLPTVTPLRRSRGTPTYFS